MPFYRYRAKVTPQKIAEGTLEAPNKEMAIKLIEEKGYFPVKIEEILERGAVPISTVVPIKVKYQEVTVFSRQLATLIKAGVPILKALEVISQQSHGSSFSRILKDMYDGLKEGAKLSSVLARYPKAFSSFYVAMIQAGEDSGNLKEVLFRLADYRKAQEDILSKVKLASLYPLIMGFVGIGTIIFMLTFVMPRLMRIFKDLGENLPIPTKILIAISSYISEQGIFLLIGVVAFGVLVAYGLRRKSGKRILSSIKLRIPVFGELVFKRELARLCRTLELLIQSGIPVLRAIELTAPIIDNGIIRKYFLEGYKELKQGASLGQTLKKFKVFPVFMTNLIAIGESSGSLDVSFGELATAYEKDTEETVKAFTTVLEPLMILGMGLIVGFVVMAMLLPIFQINLMIR
ncbi:MAG: type II secretion system F family protein [Candidatus Omnitrophota bacterium]|nr:MAG: type II secretion system F family protein [Candidatus Omnitrophota bacterium]